MRGLALVVASGIVTAGCAPASDITGAIEPMTRASATPAPIRTSYAPAAAPAKGQHPAMTPRALAEGEAGFSRCIAELGPMAQQRGVSAATWRAYAVPLTPDMSILEKLETQPEFTRATGDYVEMLVADARIAKGREALATNRVVFEAVERTYGVDRHVVAAIWGIETNYGNARGSYSVLRSTATLACIGRRQDYFRDEFVATLQILDRGDIPAEHLKGSWAGAFGLTQFMPTTFQRDAVDFDGDGHRNVVDSVADAMASTAAKLKRGGWQAGRSWGYEVKLPPRFDYLLADKSVRKPLGEWAALGVTRPDGRAYPRGGGDMAYLLLPAGAKGPAFLMTDNFKAILGYNPADAYALAIGHLADRLRGGDAFAQDWPDVRPLSKTERIELQQRLASRGYDIGTPDGVLGHKTRVAVRDFQSRAGLVPDGLPSDEVLQRVRQ